MPNDSPSSEQVQGSSFGFWRHMVNFGLLICSRESIDEQRSGSDRGKEGEIDIGKLTND